jgi:hypothetical protein
MQRVENELELGKLLKAKADANLKNGGRAGADFTNRGLSNLTKADPIHVRKEIAKAAGVSEGTVAAVQKICAMPPFPFDDTSEGPTFF